MNNHFSLHKPFHLNGIAYYHFPLYKSFDLYGITNYYFPFNYPLHFNGITGFSASLKDQKQKCQEKHIPDLGPHAW